jgi:tryptophan synthase beta chain
MDAREERKGRYGLYGGSYMPEILVAPLEDLCVAWEGAWKDPSFRSDLGKALADYGGRPTPLTEIPRFAEAIGTPATLALKREDLLHTGAHKLNNCLGQCLLAREMGKGRIIAETGAGQHGVATAPVCARLGLD